MGSDPRVGGSQQPASMGASVLCVPGLVPHPSCADPCLLVFLSMEGIRVLALMPGMMGVEYAAL